MSQPDSQPSNVWEGISPAKVNLYLAVTGRRADGFHELVSLVSQLAWGDELRVELKPDAEADILTVDHPDCPTDSRNLALKAVEAFRAAFPELPAVFIDLKKRIPMGAGLGGGSSNASTVLNALNALVGDPLSYGKLSELAASLGSDCPLFLKPGSTWMRGRGELIEAVSPELEARLKGMEIVLFRPPFSVETPWAYGQLAERGDYWQTDWAERDAALWNAEPERAIQERMFNSFERPLKEKFLAYLALCQRLTSLGATPLISGSGSACFFLDNGSIERNTVCDVIKDSWGSEAILAESVLA